MKVLRSHIENIPIPTVDESTQDNIIILTEKLISGLELPEAEKVYDELDILVSQVIAAVAKVLCKHRLWLVARVNK